MRNFLRDIESAWWHFLKPEFEEPPRDETTPQVIADWIATHRHPDACRLGCQCDLSGGGDP